MFSIGLEEVANSAIFLRSLVYFYIYIFVPKKKKKWSSWKDGDGFRAFSLL